jgi:hypothetical protein
MRTRCAGNLVMDEGGRRRPECPGFAPHNLRYVHVPAGSVRAVSSRSLVTTSRRARCRERLRRVLHPRPTGRNRSGPCDVCAAIQARQDRPPAALVTHAEQQKPRALSSATTPSAPRLVGIPRAAQTSSMQSPVVPRPRPPCTPPVCRWSPPPRRKSPHRGLGVLRRHASGPTRSQALIASGENAGCATTARRAPLLPQSNPSTVCKYASSNPDSSQLAAVAGALGAGDNTVQLIKQVNPSFSVTGILGESAITVLSGAATGAAVGIVAGEVRQGQYLNAALDSLDLGLGLISSQAGPLVLLADTAFNVAGGFKQIARGAAAAICLATGGGSSSRE